MLASGSMNSNGDPVSVGVARFYNVPAGQYFVDFGSSAVTWTVKIHARGLGETQPIEPIWNTTDGYSITELRLDGFLNDPSRVDRAWSQKGRLRSKHAAAGCAHVHADLDRENDRLIQVDIVGDSCRIPHARGVAATTRAVDSWKRPVHPTEAHLFGLDRCLIGLH